jgi:hypothetical protein
VVNRAVILTVDAWLAIAAPAKATDATTQTTIAGTVRFTFNPHSGRLSCPLSLLAR